MPSPIAGLPGMRTRADPIDNRNVDAADLGRAGGVAARRGLLCPIGAALDDTERGDDFGGASALACHRKEPVAGAYLVAPGSRLLASPGVGQFSAAGLAVPIGAAREFYATSRRTVGGRHAELRPEQTTSVKRPVTVWIAVPPCTGWVQDRGPQLHACVCVRCTRANGGIPGHGTVAGLTVVAKRRAREVLQQVRRKLVGTPGLLWAVYTSRGFGR